MVVKKAECGHTGGFCGCRPSAVPLRAGLRADCGRGCWKMPADLPLVPSRAFACFRVLSRAPACPRVPPRAPVSGCFRLLLGAANWCSTPLEASVE